MRKSVNFITPLFISEILFFTGCNPNENLNHLKPVIDNRSLKIIKLQL